MGRDDDIRGIIERPMAAYEKLLKCSVNAELAILDECFLRFELSLEKDFPSSEALDGYDLSQFKAGGVLCLLAAEAKTLLCC